MTKEEAKGRYRRRRRKKRNGCFPIFLIVFVCVVGLGIGLAGRLGQGQQEPLTVKPLPHDPLPLADDLSDVLAPQEDQSIEPETSKDSSVPPESSSLEESESIQKTEEPFTIPLGENDLYSASAYLIRRRDGAVLLNIHGEDAIWPASMTKIMTGYLGAKYLDLEEEVTLPEEMFSSLYAENASLAGFSPGETVQAEDLLYGVMIPSGAEAAGGVELAVSGSEKAFVDLMNQEAEAIGMAHTHFVNASGLHASGHVSTAADLALLLNTALDNPTFRQIFTTREYKAHGSFHPDGFWLQSTLWSRVDRDGGEGWTLLGGKTGFTNAAGQCLASLAEKNGEEYILITAGAPGNGQTDPYHIYDAFTVFSVL